MIPEQEIILCTEERLDEYVTYLRCEERSTNTIAKYVHDLRTFFVFLAGHPATKERFLEWKEQLISTHAPTSINSMLAAVNGFFEWLGLPGFKVKPLKIQREIFSRPEKELTRDEYHRLVETADKQQNRRLSLLLQTICATGIRVSELQYITVEAVRSGRAVVDCKGKSRSVFLPVELSRALRRYCRKQGIESGVIFRTKNGKPLDRSNIWKDMKALCKSACVEPDKVFPHNLRHLFARTFYGLEKDLSRLADLLGHSSVSTTRIYTMESGTEHVKQLERMGLVLDYS
ncbi:tyrosine-type recombinase/integrase [Clostridium transplantifaecale]|uniref:tyrosine-type recombinase/integrase n=1 Tax=Clostridium transplantifaecale TaxID=2479838 RepID=UPI000F639CCA|nr:tyrosine-type recombinase/integrase [Clostridium transplantifaecale]